VARAREIPGLDCDGSFAAAAARAIEVRAGELFEHCGEALDLEDVEGLHDMRVASRRLRAAMEMFRPCFPKKRFKAAMGPLKALADALGERRDPDVALELLGSLEPELDGGERRRLAVLRAELRDEQRVANENLSSHLAEEPIEELRAALGKLVGKVRT
jgi:CHAD domain-containing protein